MPSSLPTRFFFPILRRPPSSPLFPYTTLFRSRRARLRQLVGDVEHRIHVLRLCDLERVHRGLAKRRDSFLEDLDRKSTRLNSSHLVISYAVFCLKKKKHNTHRIKCTQNAEHIY